MAASKFIWADLSTYNTEKSIAFYANVFGWEITELAAYYVAKKNQDFQAGILKRQTF